MFNSKKESIDSKYNRTQTNERYSHFKQFDFTVGDEDQFDEKISKMDLEIEKKDNEEDDKLNLFHHSSLTFDFWQGYKDQEKINIIQTFRYIFYKFKKGIFIHIKNNKVQSFLPLSNANFINEWANRIDVDYDIFRKVSQLENRPYNERNINKFIQHWFCNNSLLRYEYPINESDTNVSIIKNFFEELCDLRKIPDISFFVNKRDFPLLTKNSTEPYYDMWGQNTPLVSHKYDSYLPILSMSKTDDYADILIPTHEDWARVKQQESKWFIDSRVCSSYSEDESKDDFCDFKKKKSTAVFRGSSTGDGFTIETNQRLKIAYLSSLNARNPKDNVLYLNCGITKWNSRPKKLSHSSKLQVIDPERLPFSLVEFMPLSEQQKFKYIVHIDGHVSAFRLSAMLKLNSVILIVESKWKMWFSDLLVPYEHYVPIKSDLSDLYEQIEWCKANDDLCECIAANARDFSELYLEKDGLLDYTQKMLMDLKQFMDYSRSPPVVSEIKNDKNSIKLSQEIEKAIDEEIDEKKEIIFENRNVKILKCKNSPIIIKKRKHFEKKNTNNNDYLIDFFSNFSLPNFCHIHGYDKEQNMVMNFIDGIKLYDFIANKELFDFKIYLDVLIQLCLALHVSQQNHLFVHNDLTPWNIILKSSPEKQRITYGRYQLSTKLIPVIIDFDKSHVVDENYIHRGSVNPYKFSSIHDLLTLLFTSLYQIISNHNLNKFELSSIIKIANFISGSKFYPQTFRSIHQLKGYLFSMKKHSSLMYRDKMDLEDLEPLDFVIYLKNTIRYDSSLNLKCNFSPLPPQQKTFSLSSFSFDFDKYTFWSASQVFEIANRINALNRDELSVLIENIQTIESLKIKKKIANIQTFISIYKLP